MLYYTCLHTVPMCIPVYSYHCFCHRLFRYNVLDTVNYRCLPNNQTYSWYNVHYTQYNLALCNLQGIWNYRQGGPSIRLHIHRYSFQRHHRHYFCKLSHILKFINYFKLSFVLCFFLVLIFFINLCYNNLFSKELNELHVRYTLDKSCCSKYSICINCVWSGSPKKLLEYLG